MEQPFAVVRMRGDVTDATRCVGRYWQKSAIQMGVFWNVETGSYQVRVKSLGGEAPSIGLVIEFDTINGKSTASAYIHPAFPQNSRLRTVTLEALEACRFK